MIDSRIARYELVRQAWEKRRPVWAAALSAAIRMPGASRAQVREAVTSELLRLIDSGDAYLFKVPRFWGSEVRIEGDELRKALEDDRNWRPRARSVAQLPRLALTESGFEKLQNGEFGVPSPIAWTPDWFEKDDGLTYYDEVGGQLVYVASGAAVGCILYGVLVASQWFPLIGKAFNAIFPIGSALLFFSFVGMILGGLLWHRKTSKPVQEWAYDPKIPIRAHDELGDERF
jgi:hypothetical protein